MSPPKSFEQKKGRKGGWYLKVHMAGRGLQQDKRPERFGTWMQLLIPHRWLSPHHLVHLETLGEGAAGWLVSGDKSRGSMETREGSSKKPSGRMAQTTFSPTDPSSALLLLPPPSFPGGLTEPHSHKSLF